MNTSAHFADAAAEQLYDELMLAHGPCTYCCADGAATLSGPRWARCWPRSQRRLFDRPAVVE